MEETLTSIRLPVTENREIEVFYPLEMESKRPVILLAHGAGADVSSEFFTLLDEGLSRYPVTRVYFNFPYRVANKKVPDRLPVLQESWRRAMNWVVQEIKPAALFAGGKSMGGRVVSTVASEFPFLKGLIFLGYPLHPPGKPDTLRDAHLYALHIPMLFIQGTRDSLAQFELIQQVTRKIGDWATMVTVEGGDHSFKIPRKTGKTYPEVLYWVAEQIVHWMRTILQEGNH